MVFGSLSLCEVNILQQKPHAHQFHCRPPFTVVLLLLGEVRGVLSKHDGPMISALYLFAWQIIHPSAPSYVINLAFV